MRSLLQAAIASARRINGARIGRLLISCASGVGLHISQLAGRHDSLPDKAWTEVHVLRRGLPNRSPMRPELVARERSQGDRDPAAESLQRPAQSGLSVGDGRRADRPGATMSCDCCVGDHFARAARTRPCRRNATGPIRRARRNGPTAHSAQTNAPTAESVFPNRAVLTAGPARRHARGPSQSSRSMLRGIVALDFRYRHRDDRSMRRMRGACSIRQLMGIGIRHINLVAAQLHHRAAAASR